MNNRSKFLIHLSDERVHCCSLFMESGGEILFSSCIHSVENYYCYCNILSEEQLLTMPATAVCDIIKTT